MSDPIERRADKEHHVPAPGVRACWERRYRDHHTYPKWYAPGVTASSFNTTSRVRSYTLRAVNIECAVLNQHGVGDPVPLLIQVEQYAHAHTALPLFVDGRHLEDIDLTSARNA